MDYIEPSGTESESAGCLNEAGWFFSGLVLPLGRPAYYRRAAARSAGSAILFFLMFGLLVALVGSARTIYVLNTVQDSIQQSFSSGLWPEVVIQNGRATANGAQPAVLLNDPMMFAAVDTTGAHRQIDTQRHENGFLLTRDSLHVYNHTDGYQVFPLSQLNQAFGSQPIVISQQTVAALWNQLAAWISIGSFLVLAVNYLLITLVYLLILTAIVRGVLSLFLAPVPFSMVLAAGVYAFVPAVFIHSILSRLGVSFFAMQTLVWLPLWALALVFILRTEGSDRLRYWHSLFGIPLLALLAVDWVLQWPNGALLSAAFFLATILVVIGLEMFEPEEPVAEPFTTTAVE